MDKIEYGYLKVGKGVSLDGDIQVPEAAYIAGDVKGKLSANDLNIEKGALIEGEISSATVEVSGQIKGKLIARTFLSIQSGGKVDGEIEHGDLEIQRGGSIAGTVKSIAAENLPAPTYLDEE